jgi:multidrug efflux system membrane fusion protein
VFARGLWTTDGVAARSQAQTRVVPVETATAERKSMPVRLTALGNVTPMASVAIKTQVDTTITGVHFRDGATVQKGDLLFTLDCRQIQADMKRVQAVIDGAQSTLEQSQRDVERYTELAARNATPIVTLNNARTAVNVSRATAESNRAQLENLKVQLDFCSIRAPISGRISMANVKIGNFVRQADTTPMATINQTMPVYVSFSVPQKNLPDIRKAIAAETATVEAIVPGEQKRATGQVTMIENTVDPATGMAMVRATMPNQDELLWPGTLVNTEMTLRNEEGVVVPSNAVQISQTGTFVFVVKDGAAHTQPVKVDRTVGSESIIASGLNGGETVVTDGQLLLSNGTRVNPRPPKVAGN